MQEYIVVKGARVHNLKNIDVKIPRDRFIVVTGPSGSGKSSLCFDTIYAEGHRRYVESLSAYARQFLEQLQKPDVDYIEGLSPAIAIEQKTTTKNPRSTVGTITEIYDYLRVLFTRIGHPFCYKCGAPITAQGTQQIMGSIMALPMGSRIQVLSPIVVGRKGEYKKEFQDMRREGFVRARVDGEMVDLARELKLHRHKRHNIDIVIDRLIMKHGIERRLSEAVELALRHSDMVIVNILDEARDMLFSRSLACLRCGVSYPEINPRFFSFNSPYGACPGCKGLGLEGISETALEDEEEYRGFTVCRACSGARIRKEALSIRIADKNIADTARMSVLDAHSFISKLRLSEKERLISHRVLREIRERLGFLEKVGLGYLTLDRPAFSLSGGEAQRIRLATQIGSSLTGVLYILDEPSIGLHPRDCSRLLKSLSTLRDMGNTVIVVEHDEETIRNADYILDMGPGAGLMGGWVVASGTVEEIIHSEQSITGRYLKGEVSIPVPAIRRRPKGYIKIIGAREFNLKNIDVKIPLGVLDCITGVSGSGKSTLLFEILYKALSRGIYGSKAIPGRHTAIEGMDAIDKVICIDQSPLGRTPRSNPATYTGVFTHIRDLMSQLPDSRVRGYRPGRFSFNVKGGRCETCKGDGLVKVEMHFLPDVYIPCEVCNGSRYNRETLAVRYKGKNIAEILDMTVAQALDFFNAVPYIRDKLETLNMVGLGYIQLGQSATTLSGGEAQRVKLSKELSKRATGNTIYILDEPTTGLHFVDVQKLLDVINGLVDSGNTVIIIEHNLEIIKNADYIIDLGPEGGDEGGRIVAHGTPEEIAADPGSFTGVFLRDKLLNSRIEDFFMNGNYNLRYRVKG